MGKKVTIFMPLEGSGARGSAAEDKDYRPVEAVFLAGDTYRVVTRQPQNERWAYPTGATVFAVKLHEGDEASVIVAPVSTPTPAPARTPQPRGRKAVQRLARRFSLKGLDAARAALILAVAAIMSSAAFAWLGRGACYPLQPADPIRASVVAGSLILIAALWQAREARELRSLGTALAIISAAFVLSLFVGLADISDPPRCPPQFPAVQAR